MTIEIVDVPPCGCQPFVKRHRVDKLLYEEIVVLDEQQGFRDVTVSVNVTVQHTSNIVEEHPGQDSARPRLIGIQVNRDIDTTFTVNDVHEIIERRNAARQTFQQPDAAVVVIDDHQGFRCRANLLDLLRRGRDIHHDDDFPIGLRHGIAVVPWDVFSFVTKGTPRSPCRCNTVVATTVINNSDRMVVHNAPPSNLQDDDIRQTVELLKGG
ncbi:hypothetical protein D3C86_1437400 [compost metagenome]